jgi:hypothetical protein
LIFILKRRGMALAGGETIVLPLYEPPTSKGGYY